MNIPEMTTKSVAKGTTRARTDNDRNEEPSPAGAANHKNKKSRPNYDTPPSYKAQSPSISESKSMLHPASGGVVSTGLVKSVSPDVGQTEIKTPAAGGEAPAKGVAKTQSKPKEEKAENTLSVSKCFQCNKVSGKSLTGSADACGDDKGARLCDCLKDNSDPTCNDCKSFLCKDCDRTFKCDGCSIHLCAGCVKEASYWDYPFSFCEPCGKQFCHRCASNQLSKTQCTVCYDVWVVHCFDGVCRDQVNQDFSYCPVCCICACESCVCACCE